MVLSVEEATREQSTSRLWYTSRAGRVTASRMESICRTNHSKPARSLLNAICYPEHRFTTTATQWGCKHEKLARECYTLQEEHDDATVKINGLVLNCKWPQLAASPDSIEIKCTFCPCGEGIDEIANGTKSCLIKSNDGSISLDKTHAYSLSSTGTNIHLQR